MMKPSAFDPSQALPGASSTSTASRRHQTVVDAWGGATAPVPSCARRGRATRGVVRQPWHTGAEGRSLAEGDLRHGRRPRRRRSRQRRARARRDAALRRPDARRRVGLERRRLEHAQRACSASRTCTRSACRSRPCPISGSTTRSTRSGTWACPRATPRATASARRSTSPKGCAGKLLVVHGSGDDNVHYQGTERLVNRLVELGKAFDLMVYPNRSHAISEGPGTLAHVHRRIARYFLENLPPGPR